MLPSAPGCQLAGFPRRAAGVHDPLQARALVLRTETASVALVSCDLHSFSSPRVAQEARRKLDIQLVLLACSGSHSAPGMSSRWPGYDTWADQTADAILRAIEEANRTVFPARLGAAQAPIEIGYNWRSVDEHGKLTILSQHPDPRAAGPSLNAARVWRIDDASGAMRAVVFHTACRASSRGAQSREVSADYPGVAARRVESELGGKVISLFVQGASGNIVPFPDTDPGDVLGRDVARTARAIRTEEKPQGSLQLFRNPVVFRERGAGGRSVRAETATVVINGGMALATMPGAPFIEHQIGLGDRSLIPGVLLAGHTFTENTAWLGSLPTIRAAAEGGLGAEGGDTLVEIGAGEAMVDAALVNIYRALGKLDDLPRGELVRETPPEGRAR